MLLHSQVTIFPLINCNKTTFLTFWTFRHKPVVLPLHTYWSKQRHCWVWGQRDIFPSQNPLCRVQAGRCIPETAEDIESSLENATPPPSCGKVGVWSLNPLRRKHFEHIRTDNAIISGTQWRWRAAAEKLSQHYRICWGGGKKNSTQSQLSLRRWRKTLRAIQNPSSRVSDGGEDELIIPQCKSTSWTSVSTLARLLSVCRALQSSAACIRQKYVNWTEQCVAALCA